MLLVVLSTELANRLNKVFYTTLDNLQRDKEDAEIYSQELERQRDEELEWERKQLEDGQKRQLSPVSSKSSRGRSSSEAPATRIAIPARSESSSETKTRKKKLATLKSIKKPSSSVTSRDSVARSVNAATNSSSLMATAATVLQRLQSQAMTQNGVLSLLRTFIMVAMVAWMTSNRKIRERVRKLLLLCWIKISRTVGMGMKVTYV